MPSISSFTFEIKSLQVSRQASSLGIYSNTKVSDSVAVKLLGAISRARISKG